VPLDLVDVVDAAHIRVRDLPRHPYFGVELRQPGGILVHVVWQELQRDLLPQLEVVRTIDLTHAAMAEPFDDAVATAKEGAGGKPSVIDGA
jgi:hypothetical protein